MIRCILRECAGRAITVPDFRPRSGGITGLRGPSTRNGRRSDVHRLATSGPEAKARSRSRKQCADKRDANCSGLCNPRLTLFTRDATLLLTTSEPHRVHCFQRRTSECKELTASFLRGEPKQLSSPIPPIAETFSRAVADSRKSSLSRERPAARSRDTDKTQLYLRASEFITV